MKDKYTPILQPVNRLSAETKAKSGAGEKKTEGKGSPSFQNHSHFIRPVSLRESNFVILYGSPFHLMGS